MYLAVQQFFLEIVSPRFIISKVQKVILKITQEFEDLENFNKYFCNILQPKLVQKIERTVIDKD